MNNSSFKSILVDSHASWIQYLSFIHHAILVYVLWLSFNLVMYINYLKYNWTKMYNYKSFQILFMSKNEREILLIKCTTRVHYHFIKSLFGKCNFYRFYYFIKNSNIKINRFGHVIMILKFYFFLYKYHIPYTFQP